VLVLTVMTVLLLLGSAVMVLQLAAARHQRVQAAADTAAEAAIGAALAGVLDPCAFAARGVEVQGLRQVRCTFTGAEVEVVVDEPQAPPVLSRPAYARAGSVPPRSP
jgi:hypothetical protein